MLCDKNPVKSFMRGALLKDSNKLLKQQQEELIRKEAELKQSEDMLEERQKWLQWFLVEKKLKMMKATEALKHNQREYEKGIKDIESQTADVCSKIHEAQMELDQFRKTSRKETNALKREIKTSKIKFEAELKAKEERLKQIGAENNEILQDLESQLQDMQIFVSSDKGSNKLTKG